MLCIHQYNICLHFLEFFMWHYLSKTQQNFFSFLLLLFGCYTVLDSWKAVVFSFDLNILLFFKLYNFHQDKVLLYP